VQKVFYRMPKDSTLFVYGTLAGESLVLDPKCLFKGLSVTTF